MANQELLLREKMFNLVLSGQKTITSRKGKRDITTGPLIFRMTENPEKQIVVNVTKVSFVAYPDITDTEAKKEGYASVNELRNVLIRIYGEIDPSDLFTLIEFELVK